MTIQELVQRLSKFPADTPLMILDGFNGGGVPRDLNHGPISYEVTQNDADETADCEERIGQSVVIIGFGCY